MKVPLSSWNRRSALRIRTKQTTIVIFFLIPFSKIEALRYVSTSASSTCSLLLWVSAAARGHPPRLQFRSLAPTHSLLGRPDWRKVALSGSGNNRARKKKKRNATRREKETGWTWNRGRSGVASTGLPFFSPLSDTSGFNTGLRTLGSPALKAASKRFEFDNLPLEMSSSRCGWKVLRPGIKTPWQSSYSCRFLYDGYLDVDVVEITPRVRFYTQWCSCHNRRKRLPCTLAWLPYVRGVKGEPMSFLWPSKWR